jgi:hypothetical protein
MLHIIKLIIVGEALADNEHISKQIYATMLCIIQWRNQRKVAGGEREENKLPPF